MSSYKAYSGGRNRVVILGGGPAGMSAAWRLAQAGGRIILLEKENQVGGLCRTTEYKGFRFDLGGHRFISQDAQLVEAIKILMGEELLIVRRKSVVRAMGKEFMYPLAPLDLFRKMNLRHLAACLLDCFTLLYRPSSDTEKHSQNETSLEDWLLTKFGQTLYKLFFEGYTTKLWGVHPKELSSDWAMARIPLMDLWNTLLRLFYLQNKPKGQFATQFLYPKGGIGQIFEHMEKEVRLRGGEILLGNKVTKILLEGHKIRAAVIEPCQGRKTQEIVEGDTFISTLPLPELINCLDPPPPHEILSASQRLQFRGLRFLNLLIDRPAVGKNTWTYVPEEAYIMTRIQEPRLRSPFNAPEGKTSLILEIPCDYGDTVWTMEERALTDRCLKDLSQLGIDIDPYILDIFSTWAPQAYPVYELGYKGFRDKSLSFLEGISNLVTCGRGGLFRYLFMDQSIKSGLNAAESLLEGKIIQPKISSPHESMHLLEGRSVLG